MVEHGGGKERGFVVKDDVSGDKKKEVIEKRVIKNFLHVSAIPGRADKSSKPRNNFKSKLKNHILRRALP